MGSIRVIKKKTGEESFHAEVRLRGFVERQTFRTKTQAKNWVQKTEATIKDGRYKSQSAARVHTVSDLIDRFISEGIPRQHKYFDQRVQLLTRWKQELGHLLLCDLSPSHIATVRDKLLSETTPRKGLRTPSTVNRYLAAFSKALTIAMKEWGWLDENPMRKIQKPPENPARIRFLDFDEKDRLLKACRASKSPFLFPIVAIAILIAMRSGEILNLTWNDIHFNLNTITLKHTKNGDHRVLPLTPEAADIIRQSPNYLGQPNDLVFKSPRFPLANKPISIRKAFTNALQIAKIEDFIFHDLRHTAASFMAMKGATQGELMAILGHQSPQMTYRYAHFSKSHLRDIMEKTNQNLIQSNEEYCVIFTSTAS